MTLLDGFLLQAGRAVFGVAVCGGFLVIFTLFLLWRDKREEKK